MKQSKTFLVYVVPFLLLLGGAPAVGLSAPEVGSVKLALSEYRENPEKVNLGASLDLARSIIKCRQYPKSRSQLDKIISKITKQASADNPDLPQQYYEDIKSDLDENAPTCFGLTASDMTEVNTVLEHAADRGSMTAQVNYYRYGKPNTDELGIRESSALMRDFGLRSIEYLERAAENGSDIALLNLAEIYYSGEYIAREINLSAAYLHAYEACTGNEVHGEYDEIYSHADKEMNDVASLSAQMIEEYCDER